MDQNPKSQQNEETSSKDEGLMDRRDFLLGLGRWSKIVIGGVLVGSALLNHGSEAEAAGWINRAGGGGWANRVGGGGAWANRVGGGGAWANRGAAWVNRGGAWVNRF